MPRLSSITSRKLTPLAQLRRIYATSLEITGLSAASYSTSDSGLIFLTLDNISQANQLLDVIYQGYSFAGSSTNNVWLSMTRSDGGVVTVLYDGLWDTGYIDRISGSTLKIGAPFSGKDNLTNFHSSAAISTGVPSQTITSVSIRSADPNELLIDYLIIAGGGGGGGGGNDGNGGPGGGGGGGYRTAINVPFNIETNYIVSVGGGGGVFANGTDSYISGSGLTESPAGAGTNTIKAYGGGRGGRDSSGQQSGANGGSGGGGGGGGWGGSYAGGLGNTPSTTPSQGNSGGSSTFYGASTGGAGGGGGGAGGVGVNASGDNAGNGGPGAASTITGYTVLRAGGGGGRNRGGSSGTNGTGSGGGGNAGSPGSPNTGGGGGALASGGSGVVILRYPSTFVISNPGGGLTLSTATNVPGVKITTITGTGIIRFDTPIPPGSFSRTTGGTYNFTVPGTPSQNVSLTITLTGAGGGHGGSDTGIGGKGGGGRRLTGTYVATGGSILTIVLGTGGGHGESNVSGTGSGPGGSHSLGYAGGRGGNAGGSGTSGAGGGGGAASTISVSGVGLLLVAAGGGGGGGGGNQTGSTVGFDGEDTYVDSGSIAGTQGADKSGDGGGGGGGGGGLNGGAGNSFPSGDTGAYGGRRGQSYVYSGLSFSESTVVNGGQTTGSAGNAGAVSITY